MSRDTVRVVVSGAVSDGGTFTVSYPSGRTSGDYVGGHDHYVSGPIGTYRASRGDVEFSFGSSSVTVTNRSGSEIPAGTELWVNLDRFGSDGSRVADPDVMVLGQVCVVTLGAPAALDADGVCLAQAVGGAGSLTINGALASGGSVEFDVARAVQAVSSNAGDTTQTLTVTGEDHYGATVVEVLTLNGTTAVSGKKAFKKVTSVVASAATSGNVSVGSTDVLGLPVFLPGDGYVVKELQDGSAATAGTVVAGDTSRPTGTTGDVRGTYKPNAAANGSRAYQLVMVLGDAEYRGAAQYAG